MHSGRTLVIEGTRQIECVVQYISSITHSYTIQPTTSANGKLLFPPYLVVKEPSGKFGPIVQETIFQPIKSETLTSGNFVHF